MKVLRIVPLLDFGGVEQRVRLTVLGFGRSDEIDLSLVVLGAGGSISSELISIGVTPRILNRQIRIPNLGLLFELYRIFVELKPDVVHTSGSEANFHGLIAARLAGIPVRIGEEIGFPRHDWKWRMIFKGVYSTATKVIAISNAVKQRIVDLKELKAYKVHVVYNPVSFALRETFGYELRQNSENGTFIFVTTCRLVPVKNLDMLVRVFSQVCNTNINREVKLWIVGDGPDRQKLENLAAELNIVSRIKFWGFQVDVYPFLAAADTFVLPSFSEGFSISLVEAMLVGLPSIVTDQGGPREIVEEGVTGFFIDANSSSSLRQKLDHLLEMEKSERAWMGEMAKRRGQDFSVERYIERLMEVYQVHG